MSKKIDYNYLKNELFNLINSVRQNPSSFIPVLKTQQEYVNEENVMYRPGEVPIQLNESKENLFSDAINYLSNLNELPPFEYNKNLENAADDLVKDSGPKGLISHQDSKGYFCSDRVENYCEWEESLNELLNYAGGNAEDILTDLIIDDGIEDRSHRMSLFGEKYKYIGISCGPHNDYDNMNVLVLAGKLRDKGSLYFNENTIKYNKENEGNDERKKNIKNDYQINDPDAPDNTIGLRIVKTQKILNGKKIMVTKKFYSLNDGTEHVVELEEF